MTWICRRWPALEYWLGVAVLLTVIIRLCW